MFLLLPDGGKDFEGRRYDKLALDRTPEALDVSPYFEYATSVLDNLKGCASTTPSSAVC